MSSSRVLLAVESLSAAWGSTPVLRSISFTVAEGELLVLMGPNGSGKTTLLRVLAGLEAPTGGRIVLGGEDLAGRPPHRRGLPLLFQDPVLFPNRTVYENLAYAPVLQGRRRGAVDEEVGRVVELLRLEGFEDRRPDELSGGERQRVALGRTLAARPRLILLDEPFASIDPELKSELRTEFRRVLSTLGTAAIHVTHDREEGLFLGDRVGLLFDGRLEGLARPDHLFAHPPTAHAARFLGYNLLPEGDHLLAVHPTDLRLSASEPGGLPASVIASGTTGPARSTILRTESGDRLEALDSGEGDVPAAGTRWQVRWVRSVPVPPEPLEGSAREPTSALGPKSPRTDPE